MKKTTWRSWISSKNCPEQCKGRNPCCCIVWNNSQHELHICHDPNCICHSRENYEGPKKQDSDNWIEVAQMGNIRFVQYIGKVGFVPLKPKDESYEEYHDRLRAQGKEPIPDDVVPEIYEQLAVETIDNLKELMEESR